MIGRVAALIYGLASYLCFFMSFAYLVAFIGNYVVPKYDRHRTRERPRGVDPARRDAARRVRGPAQRHSSSGLQALVDEHRPSVLRARHLRSDLEPSPDSHLLAVAADRRDNLARGGLFGGDADGDLLARLADRADVNLHDRPF